MKEQWIKNIRRKLADYEEPAPELSWQDVERAVAKPKVTPVKAKAVPLWVKTVVSVAAIAIIVIGFFMLRPTNNTDKIANTIIKHTVGNAVAQKYSAQVGVTTSKNIVLVNNKIKFKVPSEIKDNYINDNTDGHFPEPQRMQISVQPNKNTNNDDNIEATQKEGNVPRKLYNNGDSYTYAAVNSNKKQTSHGLTIGAFLANTATSSNTSNMDGVVLATAKPISYFSPSMISDDENTVKLHDENINTNINHRQPVRIGIKVKYDLTDRWSIESGVIYSYLSSHIDKTIGNAKYKTKQQLNYIGVPVSVDYKIWGNKHFNVYASAGGRTEKMIKGKATTRHIMNNEVQSTNKENVKINPLQWSVMGSMGAEYLINNNIGVYAEPGVSYYFKNPSNVPTIYKDKPLNLDLNVGIRINIK